MSHHVGLFGGTFDPVHNGHISIAQSFIDSGIIDELWVLLTPFPPHKQEKSTTSYQTRLAMLEAAFSGMEKVKINTIENSLPKPSYSIQTIRHLNKQYPDITFFYCLGEDSLAKFHTWKYYDEILEECDLLVAQRPGVSHDETEGNILSQTHFVSHTPLDISSSDIRNNAKNKIPYRNMVPEEVALIIENEQLYS